MKLPIFIFINIIMGYAHSDQIRIELVQTINELKYGVELSHPFFQKIYSHLPVHKKRFNIMDHIVSIKPRHDAFIMLNEKIIGFVATHKDNDNHERIIIDCADFGLPEYQTIVGEVIVAFINEIYPHANIAYTTLQNNDHHTKGIMEALKFEKTDSIDPYFDPKYAQGWKGKIGSK